MRVYLDYASTSPVRGDVFEEIKPYFSSAFANPDSLHSFGREAALAVTKARDLVAETLGAEPKEVYFTSGGTEAVNWAVRKLGRGSAVLSPIEHASALSAGKLRRGSVLCGVGEDGIVTPANVEAALKADTGLVCVMAVNNETGSIQPIADIANLTKARGLLFFCDCVQAACSQDLSQIYRQADAIALSGHKIGAPKGVGALVVKKGAKLSPLLVGGEQERGLRGGTSNVCGIVGFAFALKKAQEERAAFLAHTQRLRDRFEEQIFSSLPGGVRRDGEHRAPNISHLTFENGSRALLSLLDLKGVAAAGGAACSSHAAKPSHVLLAMGRTGEIADKGIRFSFGRETTEAETDFAARAVIECLKKGV